MIIKRVIIGEVLVIRGGCRIASSRGKQLFRSYVAFFAIGRVEETYHEYFKKYSEYFKSTIRTVVVILLGVPRNL